MFLLRQCHRTLHVNVYPSIETRCVYEFWKKYNIAKERKRSNWIRNVKKDGKTRLITTYFQFECFKSLSSSRVLAGQPIFTIRKESVIYQRSTLQS